MSRPTFPALLGRETGCYTLLAARECRCTAGCDVGIKISFGNWDLLPTSCAPLLSEPNRFLRTGFSEASRTPTPSLRFHREFSFIGLSALRDRSPAD
jgi:hypothetical protein